MPSYSVTVGLQEFGQTEAKEWIVHRKLSEFQSLHRKLSEVQKKTLASISLETLLIFCVEPEVADSWILFPGDQGGAWCQITQSL